MSQARRRYQQVAGELRALIAQKRYRVGDRIDTERQISEQLGIGRSVAREAVMMLEIEGLVEVRKGSGIYLLADPNDVGTAARDDIGPFELLQARQLVESSIASFAAGMVTRNDITRMREALEMERQGIEAGSDDYSGDELFHRLIAEATQNSVLVDTVTGLWRMRDRSPMWARLHERIFDASYRGQWLKDHHAILQALQMKDAEGARQAMWQHLENVRTTLMQLSDYEDPDFDGYLFDSSAVAASFR